MRYLGFPLLTIAGALAACTMNNPAYLDTDRGSGRDSGSGAGATATSSATSASSASATAGSTSSGGSTGGTETSGSGTEGTGSSGGGSSGGGSSGGVPVCPLDEPPGLFVKASLGGQKIQDCGGAVIQIAGPVQEVGQGQWTVRDCGNLCDPSCQGEEYLVEFFGDPTAFPVMPDCASISIDQNHSVGTDICAFSGIVIHVAGQDQPPVYVGTSETEYAPTGMSIQVDPQKKPDPECVCEDTCCTYDPGLYKLWFPTSSGSATLSEGQEVLGEHFENLFGTAPYDLRVLRSHAHERCGERPHFDWVMRRSAMP